MSEYDHRARCGNCGNRTDLPFGDLWFANNHVCGHCGRKNWIKEISRFVSDSVWWKPSTWFTGHWEVRED